MDPREGGEGSWECGEEGGEGSPESEGREVRAAPGVRGGR